MKDPIIKEVWKAKETVSKKASSDMSALAAQIKKEASGLRNSAARAAQKQSAPRYKRERSEPVAVSATANSQTGKIQPIDDGLVLEIEDPGPWSQDNEPIFWTDWAKAQNSKNPHYADVECLPMS